jgi:hypothetical protein
MMGIQHWERRDEHRGMSTPLCGQWSRQLEGDFNGQMRNVKSYMTND